MKEGALGAIIHQSHDNWAQPIVSGVNDPLTPDQPDDVRGLWTPENEAKPILSTVKEVFSDIEVTVMAEVLTDDSKNIPIQLKNRRPYTLHRVKLLLDDTVLLDGITLAPGATREQRIELPRLESSLQLQASYSTHQGLLGESAPVLHLPLQTSKPRVMNPDAFDVAYENETLEGKLLHSETLSLVVPEDWKRVQVNGKPYSVVNGKLEVAMRDAMEDVVSLETSRDGKSWFSFKANLLSKGRQRVRFKLAREYPKGAFLVLNGLGSEMYWIKAGEQEWIEKGSHNYRENLIELETIKAKQGDYISVLLPRFKTRFIGEVNSPRGESVTIEFEIPKVFSPPYFKVERIQE